MSSIRSNRFYNNPQVGAALEGIAAMFAPPDAGQVAAYATADARRAEAAAARAQAAREAEGWQAMTAEGVTPDDQDRYGLALKFFNPSQSFRAVGMNDATLRRGQDIESADKRYNVDATTAATRYGHDRTYAASVENNKLSELGKFFVPLNEGQNRPAVPSVIAQQYGFDGNIPQAEGRQKPLSETEWRAARADQIWREGGFSNDQLVDLITGQETPVKVIGPDGRPTFMRPGAAARMGAQAYESPTAGAKLSTYTAILPDGSRVAAVQGPDGTIRHAQTGQKLPDQVQLYDVPKPQGSSADIGLGPTTANTTAANQQEAEVVRNLGVLDAYEALVRNNPGAVGLAGLIRGTVQNVGATANDLVRSFGEKAPQMEAAAQELQRGLKAIDPGVFDPSIPEAKFLQSTLAYGLVRSENPSGEVSRQAYEDALQRVQGGGLLANSDSALAAVAAQRKILANQLTGLRTLRNPGTGRTDTTFQAPAASAPAPGAALRKRYNPATGTFE